MLLALLRLNLHIPVHFKLLSFFHSRVRITKQGQVHSNLCLRSSFRVYPELYTLLWPLVVDFNLQMIKFYVNLLSDKLSKSTHLLRVQFCVHLITGPPLVVLGVSQQNLKYAGNVLRATTTVFSPIY
jgi:hypothetical protein